nr:energy transducer TonB [Paucibacter sp. KBW04]
MAQLTERYYPSMLRDRGLQALVTLLVHVDEQGRAAEIKLKQGSGLRLFDDAAHQVARACRFTPARRGEQAIASWVEYPVRFALKAARQ